MLRTTLLLISLVFLFSASAGAEKLKLGFIVPMTGSASLMGESLNGVAKLASLRNVTTVFEDDQCDAKTALSAYFKLRNDNVHVFYLACSGSILALAPHAKRNGDLLLTTYAASSKLRETGSELFRFNPDSISVADGLLPLLTPEMRPVTILYEEQEYADSLAAHLARLLGPGNSQRVSYRPEAVSFAAEILKIKQHKSGSIVLVPVGDASARIMLQQLSQQRVGLPIIGEVNLCSYPFKPADFGLHGRCIEARFSGPAYERFLSEYSAILGHAPAYPFYDAMALDLLRAVDELAAQDTSVLMIKKGLLAGFRGQFANYSPSATGKIDNAGEYLETVQY